MRDRSFLFSTLSLSVLAVAAARADDKVDFVRDVQPLFAKHCVACHGVTKQKGGLRLDDGAKAREGGNSGPAFAPGDVRSRLLLAVAGLDADLKMPPDGKPPLTRDEVGVLSAWIEQGAKWPATSTATDAAAPRTTHWAFLPVRRPEPPKLPKKEYTTRNEIDLFILAKLEAVGLAPSAEASRPTLARRLSLDLLGLPPDPEDVDAFVRDDRPDAYERLVDRLLASPHFGERWGRHWLDAARYADSDGYEKDSGRPFAWRYRQWLIDAFNRDLPYGRFVVEQLAGDLLPGATLEQKTATGFHRNTLTNREGGVDAEQFRVEAVVDRVATTARVFLGVTLGCAQCHDHKYDPFAQRDYYSFFAFFNSDDEVDLAAPLPGDDPKKPAKVPTLKRGAGRATHVHIRGDFLRKGAEVRPALPTSLVPPTPLRGRGAEGVPLTRLDLARWIADPKNPLAPRVAVNSVWGKLFGRGLVATPEDFGTQGERPSHPELLDWLADEFARDGSLKRLLKLLVTSATYRQSSAARPELRTRDAYNVLLARQTRLRLEAEALRDAALTASGLLARRIGGPSVRPPQPAGIAELTYAGSAKWVESGGADRYRRGLYTWFQRTSPYPMLMTFDAPDANVCCVRRERSNTPLQALTLLNDPVFVECARALGRRLVVEGHGDMAARVRRGVRLCLGREPTTEEMDRLMRLYEELHALATERPAAQRLGNALPGVDAAGATAWVALARALLNLDEFVTRE